MFIQYKIRFQKDGLTITECIEPDGAALQAKEGTPVVQNALLASFQESKAAATAAQGSGPNDHGKGGGPNDHGKGGAASTNGSPVTLIGPFIFLDPEKNHGK